METLRSSKDFSGSAYLSRLQAEGFEEFYIVLGNSFLEALGLALSFTRPSLSSQLEDWKTWLSVIEELCEWVACIAQLPGNVMQVKGLRLSVQANFTGKVSIRDENNVMEVLTALVKFFPISVVWFEEVSREEIRTDYYRYIYEDNPCFYVYMGKDVEQHIYAFRHSQQIDFSSPIAFGIPSITPPISPTKQYSPNEQFLSIAALIVQTSLQLPPGLLSDPLQQSIQAYDTAWSEIGAKLGPALSEPLDIATLRNAISHLMRFPSAPTIIRNPEHRITNCTNYPSNLISHVHLSNPHYFHLECLKNNIRRQRRRHPDWPITCPLCLNPFSQELMAVLIDFLANDERTASLGFRLA